MDERTKLKISQTMKVRGIKPCIEAIRKSKRMTGKIPWNKGKILSSEHIEKLKLVKIGYKPTFGGKHYIRKKGELSEDSKNKISKKLKGHLNFNKDLKGCFEKGEHPWNFNNYYYLSNIPSSFHTFWNPSFYRNFYNSWTVLPEI